jgi:uncharacterized membrane protein YfcA
MDYFIISLVSLVVAALTLFSGFGLGTLLMPAFALFFPVEIAVAATAVVHLANNIFKVVLVGRGAHPKTVALFAISAAACAAFGAWLLGTVSDVLPIATYMIGSRICAITSVKVVIALLILIFSLMELVPFLRRLSFPSRYIPLGGALSGFFGGLSGHQGALRTAFLIKCGLSKEAFIGTMVVSAVVVDVSRITVYGTTFVTKHFEAMKNSSIGGLVIAGILAAFIGSFIGKKLVRKVTMHTIQVMVGIMLMLAALALGLGII